MSSLKVGVAFPDLRLCPKAEGRCRPRDEPPFVVECRGALRNLPRSSDISWPRKALYRVLVEGVASDSFVLLLYMSMVKIHSLSVEVGTRCRVSQQISPGDSLVIVYHLLTWPLKQN